jgi:poly(hydroxyalkanoate) depolymerase family esterase
MIRSLLLYLTLFLSYAAISQSDGNLTPVTDFGSNPGALGGQLYLPEGSTKDAPLVVLLHGCGQSGADFANMGGWNKLADAYGFVILYPEQVATNNIQRCFNWFLPDDYSKAKGEVLSIYQMIQHVSTMHSLDTTQVFIAGFSAGGAMTAAMLAAYPETFQAGAIFSGVPFGASADLGTALQAMQGLVDKEGDAWSAAVRAQNPTYAGPYPDIMLVHGADDPIVKKKNLDELTEQWLTVHAPSSPVTETVSEEKDKALTMTTWKKEENAESAFLFRMEFSELGHAMPLDPGDDANQGGQVSAFAKDVDFHAPYHTIRFFGLVPN